MNPTFFPTPNHLRKWFRQHHAREEELWIAFYKKASGKPSITWAESVDEALCVGWIDGIRHRIDDESYKIRFTPRRRGSIWSAVNIRRAETLKKEGRMTPAGERAFAARRENRSGIYSYEQREVELPEPYGGLLRANRKAYEFHEAQAPSYRKTICWWIVSAKQEATRQTRMKKLITSAERGKRL